MGKNKGSKNKNRVNGPTNNAGRSNKLTEKDSSVAKVEKTSNENVTLFSSPILSTKVLIILLGKGFKATFSFIISNLLIILAFLSILAAFLYAPGPHEIVSISE